MMSRDEIASRPQQAVLEPGISAVAWILPAIGLLFATVGTGFMWAVLRALKPQAAQRSTAAVTNSLQPS
ncbi:MAG: hypothetical protein KDE19_20900 [Caldilineaceae bacterium]|nr:hypothetical protein [Caldilineaceae bacterium]